MKKITSFSSKKKKNKDSISDTYSFTYVDTLDYGNYNNMAATTINLTSPVYSVTGSSSTTNSLNLGVSNSIYTTQSVYNTGGLDYHAQDVTITRNGKPPLKIGYTIDMIMESIGLILPDEALLNSNPALKSAYDNYQEILHKQNPELKSAIENYKMIEKIVKEPGETNE